METHSSKSRAETTSEAQEGEGGEACERTWHVPLNVEAKHAGERGLALISCPEAKPSHLSCLLVFGWWYWLFLNCFKD